MIYEEHAPDPFTSDFLSCFWYYQQDTQLEETVLPDSYYEIILQLDEPAYRYEGELLPRILLVSSPTTPIVLEVVAPVSQLCIRLYPWAISPFFISVPDKTIPIQGIDECEFNEYLAHAVQEGLVVAKESGYVAAIGVIQDALIRTLLEWQFDDKQIRTATRILIEKKGTVSILELASACHTSRRHLVRKFANLSAGSPKHISTHVRFEAARDLLTKQPDMSLAEVASLTGYTDQSHMTHAFNTYASMPPDTYRQLAAKLLARSSGKNDNVTFLQ